MIYFLDNVPNTACCLIGYCCRDSSLLVDQYMSQEQSGAHVNSDKEISSTDVKFISVDQSSL